MVIDKNGIQIDSWEEIAGDLIERFKAIYGEDINLDPSTPDGQIIGIFANALYDMQTQLARIYNGFDPYLAEGHELDKILKLVATTRLPATKSVADVEVEVSKNIVLPEDYTLKDINGQEWVIKGGSKEVVEGVNLVTFEAVEWGAIEAQANTITEQKTIIPEVLSVNNPLPTVVGRDEESDVELRKRGIKLIGHRAVGLASGILGKLLNLTDVRDAIVYENYTDEYDTEKDLAPHTMWVIVDGGDIDEIAEVIATDKTIGCGLKGSIDATYTETFLRRNGTERIHIHEIRFDRPIYTDVYIRFNVKKKTDTDIIDTEGIKEALAALEFNIAQDINATELYGTIYSVANNFIASGLELSKDGENWVSDVLDAGFAEKFIIKAENITITETV